MIHSFDTEVAKEVGVVQAVLLNNIKFWIDHNKANNVNYHDGKYWTFNSTKAFCKLFPYLTRRQIENALAKLRDGGYLVIDNYNENKYDRTLWYALTEKGEFILYGGNYNSTNDYDPVNEKSISTNDYDSISQKCEMHFPKMGNGFPQNGESIYSKCEIDLQNYGNRFTQNVEPIPDIKTKDIKTTDEKQYKKNTTCKKSKYGFYKHVLLGEAEHEKLNNEFGEEETNKAIEYLDEYIEMKGYKAKSHYLAIRKWVFNAVKEQELRNSKMQRLNTNYNDPIDWANV